MLALWSVVFKLRNFQAIRLNDVWVHYLAQIANFAGIYYFTYILKRSEWWTVPPYTGGDTDYSHPATTNPVCVLVLIIKKVCPNCVCDTVVFVVCTNLLLYSDPDVSRLW